MFLDGNPLCNLPHYFQYTICILPQITYLDNKKINSNIRKQAVDIVKQDNIFLSKAFRSECDNFLISNLINHLQINLEYNTSILENLDNFNDYFPSLIDFNPNKLLSIWNIESDSIIILFIYRRIYKLFLS